MIKKILRKILISILITLLSLVVLVWGGLAIARLVLYPEYLANTEKACAIPNIHKGFTPQGLCYDEESDTYFFSGYNGKPAELHLVTEGESKQVILKNEDGTATTGHAGGVSCSGDYVYLANDQKVLVYRLADMLVAEDGDNVRAVDTLKVDNEASFCFANDDYLFVGEFYRAVDYETETSHYYTTPAGDENKAIVSCYQLASDGTIADIYPLYSISITDQVQGFAVEGNHFILSRSWGLNPSKLDVYTGLKDSRTNISVSGKSVPLYYLDSSNLTKTVTMPAFSEGLDVSDGKVIIGFESAANKYFVGKLFFATNAVSYPLEELTD